MKIGHSIDSNGFYTGDVLQYSGIEPQVTILCPDGFYKPKWNGSSWVEGLTQQEIDAIKNAPQPPTLDDKVQASSMQINTLDERTQGMQDIDEFTLQQQMTTDDRTEGMKEIDDYTLELVFSLQAQVDTLTAEIATLKGGA